MGEPLRFWIAFLLLVLGCALACVMAVFQINTWGTL